MNIIGSVFHLCNIGDSGSVIEFATCDRRRTFVYIGGVGVKEVSSLSTLELALSCWKSSFNACHNRSSYFYFVSSMVVSLLRFLFRIIDD